jgi:hypothetical protein
MFRLPVPVARRFLKGSSFSTYIRKPPAEPVDCFMCLNHGPAKKCIGFKLRAPAIVTWT